MVTRRTALLLCLVVLAALCASAHAAEYSQLPKMGVGFDFASQVVDSLGWEMRTADDWICPSNALISGIRWWGSYYQPPLPGEFSLYDYALNGAPPGGITNFIIRISTSAGPGGGMPYDHPDPPPAGVVAAWSVAAYNEAPVPGQDFYEYFVDLTTATPLPGFAAGPFQQTQGQKFWLSITAVLDDPNKQWGWHEAGQITGSYATQALVGENGQIGWYIPCGGHDMSFELITVPEAGSLAGLALGLTGLLGVIRRRRA